MLRLWSVILAAALLGPALSHGFVLTYDMVWVPDLALRADSLGLASGLPRAVPSDAVVAVLDEVIPGELLQKLVLVLVLVAAGLGAARLVRDMPLPARLVAITLYQWNPFVLERLWIGHWPVLVGYAVLPWLLDAARRWQEGARMPARLPVLLVLGCLSASTGVVSSIALLAAGATRRPRRLAQILALCLAANAPWLVAGLLHASDATSAGGGSRDFALSNEGAVPAPLAALTLGGIWNSEVVPPSRMSLLGWTALVLMLLLVTVGARSWWRSEAPRVRATMIVCWVIGLGGALVTWTVPGGSAWLFEHVPGSGLLRDGSRLLALCAPLLVSIVGHGVVVVLDIAAPDRGTRWVFAVALVLWPVLMLPDPLLSERGRLDAATFPAAYREAQEVIAEERAKGQEGDLLVLPLSSYRQPGWNHDRKVLDPLWRYLPLDYVASDELVVAGRQLPGEDPRIPLVRRALVAPTPTERAQALARDGIGWVVIDNTAPGTSAEVSGTVLLDGDLTLIAVPEALVRTVPLSWRIAMTAAWSAFLVGPVLGVVLGALATRRHRRSRLAGRGLSTSE